VNDPSRQYVLFRAGTEEYGLPISLVSSIIRFETVTPVPRAPHGVLGVIDLRGRVIPVVDLGRKLFGTTFDPLPRSRIIVTEGAQGPVGLAVDGASEVATFAPDDLMPAPTAAVSPDIADAFEAVVHLGDRLVILLDLDRILPRAEFELPAAEQPEVEV
jgi:purine-binding chemotaxis protein CheW